MTERKMWEQEQERRVEHLRELEAAGHRYIAIGCDRMGELNNQLMAISEAGWDLHSVVSFLLPEELSLDRRSHFAVIAERRD